MRRPKQEWCEPHLEYIRKLEAYVDYLESMTTKNSSSENRSHEWKTIEQDIENPMLGVFPDLGGVPPPSPPTPTNDTLPRKVIE